MVKIRMATASLQGNTLKIVVDQASTPKHHHRNRFAMLAGISVAFILLLRWQAPHIRKDYTLFGWAMKGILVLLGICIVVLPYQILTSGQTAIQKAMK